MELPLQITFHRLAHSDVIAARVRRRAQKLEQCCERILSCRVAVEACDRDRPRGRQLRVRIEIAVPGEQIVVVREPDKRFDPDGSLAIRDAFDAMRRRLEQYSAAGRDPSP